jgi:hypothetical protein
MILEKFWDDAYKNLNYITDYVTSSAIQQEWLAQGHLPEAVVIANYHQNKEMPFWVFKFADYFPEYENFSYSLHKIATGRYFPRHVDYYKKYREMINVSNSIDIYRFVMFFEDRQPGQFYEINDKPYTDWVAGQVFSWKNDTTHMVANLGSTPRYALIATATKKQS